MSLNDRKKNFRGHFLTESISPIYLRHVQREGKTLGKTPEIVSRCQLRRSVGGRKVAEFPRGAVPEKLRAPALYCADLGSGSFTP